MIDIIEGMTTPPCENKILPCHVNERLKEISKEDTGQLKYQVMKEQLKSFYCDVCYDYFYDKIRQTLGDE